MQVYAPFIHSRRILPVITVPAWGGRSAAPVAPVLFDEFSGSGAITDHTPDIYPVGSSWAILLGSFGNLSGGYVPSGSTNCRALIDCGLADYEIRWRSKFVDAKASINSAVRIRANATNTQGYTCGVGDDAGNGGHNVNWSVSPGSTAFAPDQIYNAWSNPTDLVANQYYTCR